MFRKGDTAARRLLAEARAGPDRGATRDRVGDGGTGDSALEEEAAERLEAGRNVGRGRVLRKMGGREGESDRSVVDCSSNPVPG